MTICVDFDGTCVTHEYPKVGKDIGAASVLKRLCDKGHDIILFTMRGTNKVKDDGKTLLDDAVEWFSKNDINLFGINENPSSKTWTDSPKPLADIYIDDRNLMSKCISKDNSIFLDWFTIANFFYSNNVFTEKEYTDIMKEIEYDLTIKWDEQH